MNAIAQKLRSLINPAYAAQLGTESYERRVSAEEIERLEAEKYELLDALKFLFDRVNKDSIDPFALRTAARAIAMATGDRS